MGTGNPIIVEQDIFELLDVGGYFSGWSAYYGIMPDQKDTDEDNVITVNTYSGLGVNTNKFQRPNFQILVRSDDYLDGRTKAQNILDYLMNFEECDQLSFTINGHYYALVFPYNTAPEFLGYDKRDRALFSINFNGFVETDEHVLLDGLGGVLFDGLGNVLYDGLSGAIDG